MSMKNTMFIDVHNDGVFIIFFCCIYFSREKIIFIEIEQIIFKGGAPYKTFLCGRSSNFSAYKVSPFAEILNIIENIYIYPPPLHILVAVKAY